MNLYIALSLFSVIILIYLVITELFTILFRFTGLPDERARFQVISLLTGCGYTTKESEMFLSNRRRRGRHGLRARGQADCVRVLCGDLQGLPRARALCGLKEAS